MRNLVWFCFFVTETQGTANSFFYYSRKGCDRMGHKDDAHMDEIQMEKEKMTIRNS